jgi:hypothetical protein
MQKEIRAILPALMLGFCLMGCAQAAESEQAAEGSTTPEGLAAAVAAEVGGKPITFEALDEHMRKVNPQAIQAYYDARRAALNLLLSERLMEAEAEARQISRQELQQQIVGAAPQVTAADVEKFYNDNQNRMGGQSLDAMRQRIRTYVVGKNQQQAMGTFLEGLREKQGVVVHMDPPRAEVRIAENEPDKGPKDAPIQIVEYSDFQ